MPIVGHDCVNGLRFGAKENCEHCKTEQEKRMEKALKLLSIVELYASCKSFEYIDGISESVKQETFNICQNLLIETEYELNKGASHE